MRNVLKTDVDNVVMATRGVLLNVSEKGTYEAQRAKAIAERHTTDRINRLEDRLGNIENLLQQILEKKAN